MFERLRNALSGILDKISSVELKPEKIQEVLWDLKLTLLENDVALTVAEHICSEVERRIIGLRVSRFEDKRKVVKEILRSIL
ncbi:MAG: signal recognition particle receptor subunit alpha, partial [Candidatus Bathyarchaeia archaeon]